MTAIGNGDLVDALGSALKRTDNGLQAVPGLLKRILSERRWQEFTTQRGELVSYERFADFVVTPPLRGLGSDVALLRRVLADDLEALAMLDEVLQNPSSKHAVDNIHSTDRPAGTSQDRALRKLRKDNPEMLARVVAGELSPHAAMVEAGYRKPKVSVRTDSPESLVATLRRALTPAQLAEVARLLTEQG